jgi:hypothetical protein
VGAAAAVCGLIATMLVMGSPADAQTPPAPPQNTALPTIAGVAGVGATLTASSGSWAGATPIDFAYQWLRCDGAGAGCASISGATGGSYVVVGEDAGHRLRVDVMATNDAGAATARSEPTAAAAASSGPSNTARPTISGSAVQTMRLSGSAGQWASTSSISLAFAWLRCGTDGGASDGSNCAVISGATQDAYVLQSADVGHRLRLRVTASDAAGASTAASDPTAVVAAAAPRNTREPAVAGSARQGQRVTADLGSWSGAQPLAYAIQWLRCDGAGNGCASIAGQTASTYVLALADVNRRLRVRVTASNGSGAQSATSNPTEVVQAASSTPPTGAVRLPDGKMSVSASSVSLPTRLVISDVAFNPTVVRSRQQPIEVRVRVGDTRGNVVRDALVFVRSTPLVTSAASNQKTGQDGWVTVRLTPQADMPLRNGYAIQFFVRARKSGDDVLAGVSTRRLVQVRTAR